MSDKKETNTSEDTSREDFLKSMGASPREFELDSKENPPEVFEEEPLVLPTEDPEAEKSEKEDVEELDREEIEEELSLTDASSVFSRVRDSLVPEETSEAAEASELSRLKQEINELRNQLRDTIDSAKREISDEEDAGVVSPDWRSPELIRVFEEAGLDPDQAARVAPLVGKAAELMAEATYGPKIKHLEKAVQGTTTERNTEQLRKTLNDNVSVGLQWAFNVGGLEGEVAKDLQANGQRSLLWQHLIENPHDGMTPQRVVDSIMKIARKVSLADANLSKSKEINQETKRVVGSREEVTGALSKSVRQSSSPTPKKELSPEESILKGIVNAGSKISRLPRELRG